MTERRIGGCAAVLWTITAAQIACGQPYNTTAATRPVVAAAPATRPAAAPTTTAAAAFKPEELEQIAAPIALYPDSLLAQVLMASTYPLEVVQADRWAKANPKGKDSPTELNKLTWDPSVKSLLAFPQVLTMMSEKLDWTVKLGDAFIADQKSIMDAVQRLRNKAYTQGNLKSNEQQNVNVQATAATTTQPAAQVIVVESTSPSVVYVPTYNPTVVYGGWPYPSYPPAYYYPPSYVAGTALVSFGVGVAVGAAWGNAWGNCNWNGGDVDVDIDKNVNFNGNIDREKYKAERDARQTDRQGSRDTRQTNRQGGASTFQHDASHRQGVAYRDAGTTERFRGSGASQTTSQARDAYRGRAETGRQDIARGGADAYRGQTNASRTPAARPSNTGTRSNGFNGVDSGRAGANASSNRGQSSRSSPSYSGSRGGGSSGASRGGSSGGSRGGGGGARGGSGRGGGRR